MDYIFRDNKIVGAQNASCKLYEFEEVRRDFKTDVFVFEIVVHDYGSEFMNVIYSGIEILYEENQGKATRKAIEKFDNFCAKWFDK